MFFNYLNISIRLKLLVLLIVNMGIFMTIMMSSYFFTDTNVKSIENIDKHELPVSLLHAQNFSLLENLMSNFTDASITGEKEILFNTVAIKLKLLNNIDSIGKYNSDIYHLKALLEEYYMQAYAITYEIIENKSQVKNQRLVVLQEKSNDILNKFKVYKEESSKTLVESLKSISESSTTFFKNSFIMSIIGFFFVFVIGVVTYRNINNRFTTILNLVENLTIEKPDFSLELKDNHNDELGRLTKLFSKISTKLENTNHILEKEVQLAIEKTKKQEQKLIEQSRLAQMGEMISMIAHQWRQPLNIINAIGMNLSFMAEEKNISYDKLTKMIEDIERHTQHMSKTIDDFRNFFKPTNQKTETDFEVIVENTLSLIKASIDSRNIEIIVAKNDIQKINIHENEVVQVVINIIKNAEDALVEKAVENPYIKISIYTQNEHNILEIKDNAGGINEKNLNKIFEPYFSTKGQQEGTGLGLYMSQMIIKEHCDGQLLVENDEFGAVFKIVL